MIDDYRKLQIQRLNELSKEESSSFSVLQKDPKYVSRIGMFNGGQPSHLKTMDVAKNENFVSDVAGGLTPDQPIVVICRSGARSAAGASALTAAGFTEVYNVDDGFEGDPDADSHRTGGWRGAGLPWKHQ